MYLFDNFMGEFELIAKTFQGLEEVLAKELVALGANNVQLGRRMVSFTGDKELMYKANFHLRTAIRILKPIMHFKAADADEVYNVIKSMTRTVVASRWAKVVAGAGSVRSSAGT